jgi:outer membrane protein
MNFLRINLLILGMQFILQTGFGQEKTSSSIKTDTLKLSLVQAQQFALDNNQSVLNANLDVESARKKVWETTAIGLPQVSGKLAYSYSPELSPNIESFVELFQTLIPGYSAESSSDMKWSTTATLTATQLIFSGSYLVGLQSAKIYKSLSEINQVKSKQDITESVSNSYFNMLIARENHMIVDSTYSNLVKTLSDMQAMGNQGFVEETDVDQMQITVSTVKSSLDMIVRLEDIAEKLLKIQLGINLDTQVVLTDSLNTLVNSLTYDQLLAASFVLDNNISYKALDAQVQVSELLLKLRKTEFLPDLAAYYQYQKEFNDKAFSFTPPHVIGLTMNVPIFGSGSKLARVSQAKIDLMKAKNSRDQAANSLWLSYYDSKSALITAHDKYGTEKKNLQLAKKIYDRALIKYTNGIISSTDLTQIQNQYLTVQSNYYTSLQNLIASKNKLEKLLINATK